jgi:hypothetical protein
MPLVVDIDHDRAGYLFRMTVASRSANLDVRSPAG